MLQNKKYLNRFASYFKKQKMIIIPIKESETIDRALKKFKKKFERTGVIKQLRERQAFTKPSIKRRTIVKRAIYRKSILEQGII